tara:strand:+ start:121 stop:318 length:198 start_codon:yes stop_codon:yes gene_type:complete
MYTLLLLIISFSSQNWLCEQVESQYKILNDKLEKLEETSQINELKFILKLYWEENHQNCFHDRIM